FALMYPAAAVCMCAWAQRSGTPKPPPSAERPPFAMLAGQQYENLGEWQKAEEQYLKAGQGAATAQAQALAGIARMRQQFKAERRDGALGVAKELARQKLWKQAEEQYMDLLKSDPEARDKAAAGLQSLQPKLFGERWPEAFDELAGKAGRLFLVASLLLVAG